jgi:hypothetical protein
MSYSTRQRPVVCYIGFDQSKLGSDHLVWVGGRYVMLQISAVKCYRIKIYWESQKINNLILQFSTNILVTFEEVLVWFCQNNNNKIDFCFVWNKKTYRFWLSKKNKNFVSRKQFLALGENSSIHIKVKFSIPYHARLFALNRVWKHDVFSIISKVGQLK